MVRVHNFAPMKQKKRIIIFDDSKARCDSISVLLSMYDDMEFVAAFPNAKNAVQNVKDTAPDLVLMDIDMPNGDGITGTASIKATYADVPVIIQTVFDNSEHIFEALKAGADGYILKKTQPEKFIEQIREVFNGGAPMTASVAQKVLLFFKKPSVATEFNLSEREKEILKFLVEGKSYKMIADKTALSYFTVCNHIKKIYDKLHVNSATEAVSVAIQNKIV